MLVVAVNDEVSLVYAAFRQEAKEKSKRKAEQVKKRKAEEAERLHPHQSADVTEHIADIATQGEDGCLRCYGNARSCPHDWKHTSDNVAPRLRTGPIAGQRFIQQQQQQLQTGLPPYLVQAAQQGFATDAPKPAQPAATQYPKVRRTCCGSPQMLCNVCLTIAALYAVLVPACPQTRLAAHWEQRRAMACMRWSALALMGALFSGPGPAGSSLPASRCGLPPGHQPLRPQLRAAGHPVCRCASAGAGASLASQPLCLYISVGAWL